MGSVFDKNIQMSISGIQMYGEIVKVLGQQSETFAQEKFDWSWSVEELGICLKLDLTSEKPKLIFLDAFDNFDKVYQLIGFAHYMGYEVECNF